MTAWQQISDYIAQQYGISVSYPFGRSPNVAVWRHSNAKQRMFALITQVKGYQLGLNSDEQIEIINLKCDPAVIDGLRSDPAVFPAWHMNKAHWFSLRLDSSFPTDQVYRLIDWSFDLTK